MVVLFFFIVPATTEIYTLSLHDALPICPRADHHRAGLRRILSVGPLVARKGFGDLVEALRRDRKSTRLNSSHGYISYAVFCLKKKIVTILRGTFITLVLDALRCPIVLVF